MRTTPGVNRLTAEAVTGPLAHHAEGPVWSPRWGGLRYVDLTAGALLTLRDGRVDRLELEEPVVSFVRPTDRGGYVVGLERGIGYADRVDGPIVDRLELWTDPSVRMNDGTVDPEGRILAGGMAYDARPGGSSLFRIHPDRRSEILVPEVTVSNGIGFSPAGERCFYVDSLERRIDVFDVARGELEHRRVFVDIPERDGLPDGLAVSADGSVWVALWGGAAVHGYGSNGKLHTIVQLPVRQVSACAFGGEDLATLFITTSRQGLAEDEEPEAGSVYSVRPGVRGLPTHEARLDPL